MSDLFFEKPILNSPYAYPTRHWELDADGQPTQQIIEKRRRADFITPIPKPRKRKDKGAAKQEALVFDEGQGLSTREQQYDPTAVINAVRAQVDKWRDIPDPNEWGVTPAPAPPWDKPGWPSPCSMTRWKPSPGKPLSAPCTSPKAWSSAPW